MQEVSLRNLDGYFLTSETANVGSAADQIQLPAINEDWSHVDLLNLPGPETWPIINFSYLYIRKNLASIGHAGPLLQAFLRMIISEEGM